MKFRIFLSALFLLANPLTALHGFAQGTATLHVTDMPNFPDTAYEQNYYAFDIVVANNTNISVQNGLMIQMRVDSIISTILSNPAGMQPGDTVSFSVTGFSFTQPQFKAGNNIVVVWPVVNGTVLPVDSFFTNVFFITLSSLGTPEPEAQLLHMYPVPSNGIIHLDAGNGKSVEYVRIFDAEGKLVSEIAAPHNGNLVVDLPRKGVYVLEAVIDGVTVRRKFIRD